MSLGVQIFCLLLLVCIGGFFSFSEISLAAARKLRLRAMTEEGVRGAARTLKTKENPGRYFSVIQIGNNMAAIMGGIVGESAFSPYFTAAFRYVLSPETAAQLGFICSFLLITCAVVLLSDLLPKRLAMNNPERNAILVSMPMHIFGTIISPFVWIFDNLANAVLRLLNIPLAPKDKLTSDDILATVSAGSDQGIIDANEQAVIENVFNMENRPVTTAMTARESIVYFTLDESEAEIRKQISQNPHNYFLVCDGDIDHVIGFIDSKNVLRRLLEGKPISITEQGLVQQVQFVPDTLTLSEILEMFQRSRGDFAVVLNEYALVVGIVTLALALVLGEPVHLPTSGRTWAAALFLGIFCSGVAFVIQSVQQQYTTASHVGLIFTLEPVFASMVAFVMTGEVLSLRGYIGAALMLLSLFIMEGDWSFLGRKKRV